MANLSNLAYPYANALFQLAKANESGKSWIKILQDLVEISKNNEFMSLLNNPSISKEQIIEILKLALKDQADEKVMNFLQILAKNDRLAVITDIYNIFNMLILEDEKKADAIIESAFPLLEDEKQVFEQILSKKFNKQITAKVRLNSELIGGVKILINDRVIDASIKGSLSKLATQLTK